MMSKVPGASSAPIVVEILIINSERKSKASLLCEPQTKINKNKDRLISS